MLQLQYGRCSMNKAAISDQEVPVTLSDNKKEKAWNNLKTTVKNIKVNLPKDYDYKL